jgi:hypothetical protein
MKYVHYHQQQIIQQRIIHYQKNPQNQILQIKQVN